ncbi:MAG: ribbon-helix-helix protein, CopG family [Bacillota bacterium]
MIEIMTSGMIALSLEGVATVSAKITVSLPEPLVTVLDRLAERLDTSRSGAVAELLRRAEREELERELEEGYIAWAEANRSDAELFLPAQAEVVLRERG